MKDDHSSHTRWLMGYSFNNVNLKKILLSALLSMPFVRCLHHLLHEIIFTNPYLRLVFWISVYNLDGLYCIDVNPYNYRNLGLFFRLPNKEPLVVLPTVLPMGRNTSPPLFFINTKTTTIVFNSAIRAHLYLAAPPSMWLVIIHTSAHAVSVITAVPIHLCVPSLI